MSKVSKETAINKIKATNPLEVQLFTIKRDAPESQKNSDIDKVIKLLREYRNDQRDITACLVKEK
ncbi:MAG TPA: hypothetical protein PKD37_04905 [Oligoflexia bacterium]|nr:hypothetical protein [Oligoflexia bacterium]HMP27305.1 hypothetical protein [Oligoflexia bacterium]